MAFHQPTHHTVQRVFRPTQEEEAIQHVPRPASQPVEDSQTWVLFAPATDAGTTTSYLSSNQKTDITPGHSRLSDLGSLNTIARAHASVGQQQSASLVDVIEDDEDDAELDSLDSHLPEFRSTPDLYNSSNVLSHATPVLPTHDGLGLFRLEQEGLGADVQEQMYAFEQYNPRRVRRRRESLDLAQTELENEHIQEIDKMRRIEAWRLEQSRYLLERIQKETRRRRRSAASTLGARQVEKEVEGVATLSATGDMTGSRGGESDDWHDHDAVELETDHESIWGRITRKVIRDLLGIDDKSLSILVGEALPDEEDLSSTPKASATPVPQQQEDEAMEDPVDSGWQLRMLERVAKELGLLVHRLSEHPGAFSTYTRVTQMHIPYAGLPSIPESISDPTTDAKAAESPAAIPEFRPTIGTQVRPINIPQAQPSQAHSQKQVDNSGVSFTQEEWEQDLDIRLVFRYLRSRFMSRSSSATGGVSGNSHLATSGTQDAAAKAARVRQHHPLLSRSRATERRKSKATTPSSPVLFRHASSCASPSTRRSMRRGSGSTSRHYWDIGGSVGTGSLIVATGPMGSWGEV
ncbi:hypothetical protein F4779DRAFT_85481 [Xylariaceae sp. FL0662B]|nr:hypothetical protein F4779DRAFT_85481 [Xylariaceae sp. FL0662B]